VNIGFKESRKRGKNLKILKKLLKSALAGQKDRKEMRRQRRVVRRCLT